jgi:Zn-dependent protease with chaperone function
MKANRKYWLPRIERLYLPAIRSRYRELNEHYGKKLSQDYRDLVQHLSPMVTQYPVYWFRSSWKRFPAGFRRAVRQVPAPLKKTLDRYHSWSLKQMHRWRGTLQHKAPSQVKTSLMHLAKAMKHSRDRRLNLRIHKAFERIRPYAADASMHSCYRVVPLESSIVNAFNTGCTTYITSALARKLTELELSAVLAHEVAHGDQGHAVKNLLILSKSAGQHMFRLVVDEARWLLTGRWSKHLQTVVNKGHLTPLLQSFGKKAPAIELEADIGAVGILKRARISPQHLISALMKLHGRKPGSKVQKELKDLDGLRNYPSLYRRIQAVRKAAR